MAADPDSEQNDSEVNLEVNHLDSDDDFTDDRNGEPEINYNIAL